MSKTSTSHKFAETAPLWIFRLRMRSRIAAVAAAAALSIVVIFLLSMAGYMGTLFIAVFMVPVIPGTILGTANVLPAEVNAQLDTFTFMSVMPTLFVVIVGAIVTALVIYKILRVAAHYIFSLWAVAGLSARAVSSYYTLLNDPMGEPELVLKEDLKKAKKGK